MRRIVSISLVAIFAACAVCGRMACDATNRTPLVVTPSAMIRTFRDHPAKAAEIYEGQFIAIAIRDGRFRILDSPAIIVSDPMPPIRSNTTTGVVRCRRDGIYTGDNCYFTIVLESARHTD